MADNYRQFSGAIALATPAEAEWCETQLGALRASDTVVIEASRYEDTQAEFDWQIQPETDGTHFLWIYCDGGAGDVAHAAAFVQRFLGRFHPDDSWWLSWADTCSKLRINEFSGGAVFVTAKAIEYLEAQDWARRRQAAFQTRPARRRRRRKAKQKLS